MKFSCDRTLLLAGLSNAARAAAAKSTIPALEGLLLAAEEDGLTITGYNLKTGVRTRVPADVAETGSIVLNARLFGDIVRKMSAARTLWCTPPRFRKTMWNGLPACRNAFPQRHLNS